jgi:cation:H+ antiporter
LAENNFIIMLLWLGELTISSWVLSYGAEHLSIRYGAKFVGRTLLSVATTLPEIAIVIYAAADGFYGIAIGAGLGSNLLMMTLGLAIMILIATTRLSRAPLKGISVSMFKLDKIFLLTTAIVSALLFIDGYDYLDGFIFSGMFIAYLIMALLEMRTEKRKEAPRVLSHIESPEDRPKIIEIEEADASTKTSDNRLLKAALAFLAGTIGILVGAEPFIQSLEGFSSEIGVSSIVLAVVISPIAGEMPEKISMMILARKGAHGASIAIANVLGSKILNNTLLLAVAVFGAMFHAGFFAKIELTPILSFQVILVTVVTIIALIPMFIKKEIGLKVGTLLLGMYIISLFIQFLLPHDPSEH